VPPRQGYAFLNINPHIWLVGFQPYLVHPGQALVQAPQKTLEPIANQVCARAHTWRRENRENGDFRHPKQIRGQQQGSTTDWP